MTLLTMNNSDFKSSHQVLSDLDKLFCTKSTNKDIVFNTNQNTTLHPHFAYNPILNKIVQINPDQLWFWNPEWLQDEMMIETELQNGDYEDFDNIDDFIENL
jgi:hypothetical protein